MGILDRLLRRAPAAPPVHPRDQDHVWEPIRRGFEAAGPFVCRCGALGTRNLRAGTNSITLSPGSGVDVIRWSASFDPQLQSDIGMNVTTGRPQLHVGGRVRGLAMSDDYPSVKRRGVMNNPSATTLVTEGGLAAPTVEGTASLVHGLTGLYISYSTAAAVDSDAGWIAPTFNVIRRSYYARFEAIVATISNTVLRTWIGLFSGDPMGAADPAGLHLAAFRFDTSAGDTTWKCCVKDGTTLTVVDTGLAVTGSAVYLKIDMDATNVNVRFSHGLLSTTGIAPSTFTVPAVPGLEADLGYCVQTRALEAAFKTLHIARMGISEMPPMK